MKFRIRFADQIVGVLLAIAALALICIIFLLGKKQRWFARDHNYKTYFDSAAGLSPNMSVQYKGFTIGNIKSFKLTEDDRVEVVFVIHDDYTSRVTLGSLVDINVSPIGLGNQFRFHPGRGKELVETGGLIPAVNSPEGKKLIESGLSYRLETSDGISLLLSQINDLIENLDNALKGTAETSLGRTLIGIEETVAGVKTLPETVKHTVDTLIEDINPILADVNRITTDLNQVTEKLNAPDGLVATVLDGEGAVYTNLEASLKSLSGILKNLDKTASYLPADMTQIAGLLMEVRKAVKSAEDVLTALTNNPLLKGGIPRQVQSQAGGTNLRDVSF
ncbi:MAG: MlaD family protein [Treponema sp.]|nr:MlaD family protein [Treponema sp.]